MEPAHTAVVQGCVDILLKLSRNVNIKTIENISLSYYAA